MVGEAEPSEGDVKPSKGEAEPSEGGAEPSKGEVEPSEGGAEPSEGEVEPSLPVDNFFTPKKGAFWSRFLLLLFVSKV